MFLGLFLLSIFLLVLSCVTANELDLRLSKDELRKLVEDTTVFQSDSSRSFHLDCSPSSRSKTLSIFLLHDPGKEPGFDGVRGESPEVVQSAAWHGPDRSIVVRHGGHIEHVDSFMRGERGEEAVIHFHDTEENVEYEIRAFRDSRKAKIRRVAQKERRLESSPCQGGSSIRQMGNPAT
ncbi:hypothetical protein IE53DRAFT_383684 [Violaceomyces palustris]|uniref:Uncharacterized protein n=1 Tax=Violaceomyces palustris TaxID=1673888 RepID=A0ACD0P6X0_9BASI|nr:hypothetical protein IE53DRAFT_383684 [Violaceomyces palustris]